MNSKKITEGDKIISVRIEKQQYEVLKSIEKSFKMRGIGCLIRRSIDLYLETLEKGG